MERKFLIILLVIFLIFGLSFATIFIIPTISPGESVIVNHIKPDMLLLHSPAIPVSHTFSFEKGNVTISVPVNNSVYWGAKRTNKSVRTSENVPVGIWAGKGYRSMIEDPAQDDLYTNLLGQFQKIRKSQNLSDDEYAELLAAYAQSITYNTSEEPAKYPIETVYDAEGDCDDKSLLLAGLLSREGYNVALLLFEKDKHVVVGIGSDDNRYLNTEYAYVEIMDYSFIGIPVNKIRGSKKMYLDPIVVPIGNGTKIYHSGGETRFISDMASLADERSVNLSFRMWDILQDTAENISEFNRISGDFYDYSRIYTYIIRHRFDRPGVFEYLKKEMPA